MSGLYYYTKLAIGITRAFVDVCNKHPEFKERMEDTVAKIDEKLNLTDKMKEAEEQRRIEDERIQKAEEEDVVAVVLDKVAHSLGKKYIDSKEALTQRRQQLAETQLGSAMEPKIEKMASASTEAGL